MSLPGILHFTGRSRNSSQAHELWPPHTRYVISDWVVGNEGWNANSFNARVVVAPLVLAMEMEARLSHQRVPARSRLYAVSRSGESGALAHSLHSLPASLQTLHSRLDTLRHATHQMGNIVGEGISVPVLITRRPLGVALQFFLSFMRGTHGAREQISPLLCFTTPIHLS